LVPSLLLRIIAECPPLLLGKPGNRRPRRSPKFLCSSAPAQRRLFQPPVPVFFSLEARASSRGRPPSLPAQPPPRKRDVAEIFFPSGKRSFLPAFPEQSAAGRRGHTFSQPASPFFFFDISRMEWRDRIGTAHSRDYSIWLVKLSCSKLRPALQPPPLLIRIAFNPALTEVKGPYRSFSFFLSIVEALISLLV